MTKKRLNVVCTSKEEIKRTWGQELVNLLPKGELFIRCNRKGEVNWDVAPVYVLAELLERGSVKIIER